MLKVSVKGLILSIPASNVEMFRVTDPAGALESHTSMVAVDPSAIVTDAGVYRIDGRSSSVMVIVAGVALMASAGVPDMPVIVIVTVSLPSTMRSATEVKLRLYMTTFAGIMKEPARAVKSIPGVAVPVTVYETVLAVATGFEKAKVKVPVPTAPGPPSVITGVDVVTLAVELSSLMIVYTQFTIGPARRLTNVLIPRLIVSSFSTRRSPRMVSIEAERGIETGVV